MKLRKRWLTLVELIVAMVLASLILTTLMFFYRYVSTVNAEVDRLQGERFEMLYLENRLAHILPRSFYKKGNKSYYFFTEKGVGTLFKSGTTSLIFTFDNCVKLDPRFAYNVLGRLYVDFDKRLWLAIWPLPTRWDPIADPPMHKELLMEGVEGLDFEFFIPLEKELIKPKKEIQSGRPEIKPEPAGEWVKEWLKDYRRLPAMVRMHVTRTKESVSSDEDRKLTYAFPLPLAPYNVLYDR